MAPHSSTVTWKIPWTEEPGGLQSMGSLGVGHDWATALSPSCIGEGNGNSLQCSCLENPRDGGAWWAAVNGVTQSQTRLKRLSSSNWINLSMSIQWIIRINENEWIIATSSNTDKSYKPNVKEERHQRIYMVWFHRDNIQKQAKLNYTV